MHKSHIEMRLEYFKSFDKYYQNIKYYIYFNIKKYIRRILITNFLSYTINVINLAYFY